MSALTKDTPLVRNKGEHASHPILTNTNIYQGAMIGLTAAGYARGFALGDRFRGHTLLGMDNTGGASGAKYVETLRGRYILQVALSGVAITDGFFSSPVYAQDDGTLSLRSGLQVGRVLKYVSSGVALVEFDTEQEIQVLSETMLFSGFTDNTNTTGYKDFVTAIPKGALVLGWQIKVVTGFTGDTSAAVQVGESGNLDRFSQTTTRSVLAAGIVGNGALAVSGDPNYAIADTTVRVTVTGAADFTSISAGEMDVKMIYIPRLAV